jgi:hypothetical protein
MLLETRLPSITGLVAPIMDVARLALGLLVIRFAFLAADQSWHLPWQWSGFAVVLAFFGCLVAGWLGGVAWPNSGDEYSYVYLADTFRAGRLWNPPPPDSALFANFHVLVQDGKTFSPYPPGWSALLVPFRALKAMRLANPLMTVLLGTALIGAYRCLQVSPSVQKPMLVLVLLTPFTLFLGGSLFPQTMACALVASIVWAQLSDEVSPRFWRKLVIGVLFGILLLVRYDVFAMVALIYAIDRLVLRGASAISDGLLVMGGLLPFVVCLAFYDAAITGSPFQLTADWATSGVRGPNTVVSNIGIDLLRPAILNLTWLGELALFGGLPILVLSVVALTVKLRHRTLRFYDLLLPAAVIFYSFLPFTGGHQYGPRYWFWAWPVATLTIATGLVEGPGYLRIFGRRVAFSGFAVACLIYTSTAFLSLLVTTHVYIGARRAVFDGPLPKSRAIVLLPDRSLKQWWWSSPMIEAKNLDFTRNDIDYNGSVLYGRGDLPDAIQRACQLPGRDVFRWEAPGRLTAMKCP